jgi:hypothetical protein
MERSRQWLQERVSPVPDWAFRAVERAGAATYAVIFMVVLFVGWWYVSAHLLARVASPAIVAFGPVEDGLASVVAATDRLEWEAAALEQ